MAKSTWTRWRDQSCMLHKRNCLNEELSTYLKSALFHGIDNKRGQLTISPEEAANSQFTNNQFHDETRIHQRHNDTTLNLHLTHRPARAAIRLIPYPRNKDLIHRPDLVDKLNTLLPYPSAISHSAALWGLGGSGLSDRAFLEAVRET
ncbi:hypothetical protein CI102_9226 [Trichoderma harzianum]|nr:hypothetical protein CI102_9226 [Trichoderma harzianum]